MNKREYKIKRNIPRESRLIKLYTDTKFDV